LTEENHEKPIIKIFKLIFETRNPWTQNENTNYSTATFDLLIVVVVVVVVVVN